MLDFAFGELQLLPEQFWPLTWGQYQARCRGFTYREEVQWVHTRYMVAMNLNIHVPKGKKPIKPEDLIRLSFDKPKSNEPAEVKQWTAEELLEIKYRQGILPRPKTEESN